MDKRIILAIAFLIVFANIVSSAPPSPQFSSSTTGLDVAGIDFSAIKTNTQRTAVANVFNATSGLPMTSGVSCQFQVFRVPEMGSLIFTNSTPIQVGNTFYFGIPATVYNLTGEYTKIIQCNSSTAGGFYKSTFIANSIGIPLTPEKATIYLILMGVLVSFFLLVLFFAFKLDDKNERNDDGEIISLNYMKYFKSILLFTDYMIMISILFISSNLAFAYLDSQLFAKILFTLFKISFGLILPIVFVWLIWIFVQITKDKKLKQMISKGIYPGGRF